MKKLTGILLAFIMISFVSPDNPLTKKERKFAVDLLKDTHKALQKSIDGLTDEQRNFKASDSTWSVDGCVKHIAVSEKILFGAVEEAMKKPVNPEKRADIKSTDEQIVNFMESRTTRVKTMDAMKPENSPFQSTAEALNSINESRKKIIDFVNSTNEDLRNHVVELPFGTYDAYQIILMIGAHSNRHTQQIEEVKAQPGYPKG
jgi:hypothetical protein